MAKLDERRIYVGDVYQSLRTGMKEEVMSVKNGTVTFTDGSFTDVEKLGILYKFLERSKKASNFDVVADDFSVSDGKLLYKGNEIKAGISFEEVLCAFRDRVYLKIKSLDGEKHTVVAYSVKDDKFSYFEQVGDTVDMFVAEPLPIFLFNNCREDSYVTSTFVKVDDIGCGGNFEQVVVDEGWVFDSSSLYSVTDSSDGSGKQIFLTSNIKNVEDVKENDDEPTHYHQEEVDDTFIDEWTITHFESEELEKIYYVFGYTLHKTVHGKVEDIGPRYDGSCIVTLKDGIVVYCTTHLSPRYFKGKDVVEAYKNHPTVFRADLGTRHNVLYLVGAEDNDMVKIHCEKTEDRGFLNEVLPFNGN